MLKHRAQHTNPFFWTLFRHDIVKMLAHTPVYPVLFPRPDKKSNQKNCKPKAIIKREVFKAKGCRHTDVCQARQHRKIPFLVGCGGFGYGVLCLKNKYLPVKRGGISFSGKALTITGNAQVRFRLACQPCNCYLLPINGSRGSNMLNWSLFLSFFNCSAIYSFIAFVFFPTVST